jgi:hypothetical protein
VCSSDLGKASLTTLRLVDRDRAIALADGAADDEVADLHHGASVVGGLGRYVIVVESEYVFACGAHGNEDVQARTIDATTGAEVAPWVSIAEVDAAAARARAALISPGALTDGDALGEAQLGVTVPTWTDGRVGVSHLIYFDTCYACGNGVWSSYTSGGWAAGDKVPAAVANEARDVPAPVARALSSISAPSDAPAQAGVSWGAVTSAWTAAFPRA